MNLSIPRLSLTLRMGLLIAVMALLALAAGAGSFWLSAAAVRGAVSLQQAAGLAETMTGVQSSWLDVIAALDGTLNGAPGARDYETLSASLEALNRSLDALSASVDITAGEGSVLLEDTRQVLIDLRSLYARMDGLANQVFSLAADNRPDEALQARQAGLPELQAELAANIDRLNANLKSEMDARRAQAERIRAMARLTSGVAALLAVLIAVNVYWVGRRVIVRPLAMLADQVNRMAQGDLSEAPVVERSDEIGRLSQSVGRVAERMRAVYAEMEQRIQERTAALERRTVQVQAAAQTARDIATARSLNQLLENAVELIRDRFGFYHAGIFLTDARGDYQVLRAATGDAGRAMLARAHSLRIGAAAEHEPTGLVGTAAYRGEPLVSSDVSQDEAHFKNPLLPETRSEAALPLLAGGRVIGVLDVQSREPQAFDPESLSILQVMADQLAIAIQNASLLNEVQRNLADVQQAYGELEHTAWLRFFQVSPEMGYVFDGKEIRPAVQPEDRDPAANERSAPSPAAPLTLPLRVRGQEIGALQVWPRQAELSSDEVYLLETLNSRLSQILESARLYEETQARAAREELINRLTTNIARALDMDDVLRSAAIELGSIPTVSEAVVTLLSPEPAAAGPTDAPSAQNDERGRDNGHAPSNGDGSESDGGGNGHRA